MHHRIFYRWNLWRRDGEFSIKNFPPYQRERSTFPFLVEDYPWRSLCCAQCGVQNSRSEVCGVCPLIFSRTPPFFIFLHHARSKRLRKGGKMEGSLHPVFGSVFLYSLPDKVFFEEKKIFRMEKYLKR